MTLMGNIGMPEVILIVLILIVIFGSKKISDVAKNAGQAGKELKKIKKEYSKATQEVEKIKMGGGVI
ncbi:MAG: twin-arginine translocase TatA/TatE family subunit [bacterium]|nr:MAG: twin-arginine translocase TatA/TatE family subunit [bacterium]